MKIELGYSKGIDGIKLSFSDEEEERNIEKYGLKIVLLQKIITCCLEGIITPAVPYLGVAGTKAVILCANDIFSLKNIDKALNKGYEGIKQVIDTTKNIGTEVFNNISDGMKEIANTAENGARFLCGVLKMFGEKIIEKITSLGAPEQTCNDIREITNGFDKAAAALDFGNNMQKKEQPTQVASDYNNKTQKKAQSLPNVNTFKNALSDLNNLLPDGKQIGQITPNQ